MVISIGIDLGTSNSAAAVLRGVRPVLIPSAEGVSLGGKAFSGIGTPTGHSRPSGSGPRGRVVDAENKEIR